MKIYTKTGDKGTTSLFTGERVKKDHQLIAALGSVDECNSALGVAISLMPLHDYLADTKLQLETIQHALFDIGAAIATPLSRASNRKLDQTRFNSEATISLEQWIDAMQQHLPALQNFILPGGHPCGAMLHLARTLCRKAECAAVPLFDKEEISENVLVYLNRLSDYLFVVSRYVNQALGSPETTWRHLAV